MTLGVRKEGHLGYDDYDNKNNDFDNFCNVDGNIPDKPEDYQGCICECGCCGACDRRCYCEYSEDLLNYSGDEDNETNKCDEAGDDCDSNEYYRSINDPDFIVD